MSQNDKYLQDRLNDVNTCADSASAGQTAQATPCAPKKKGGTGSFIVGFVFGLIGVLVACCWGGAGAAFRGFLWRLGITIVVCILGALAR